MMHSMWCGNVQAWTAIDTPDGWLFGLNNGIGWENELLRRHGVPSGLNNGEHSNTSTLLSPGGCRPLQCPPILFFV